MRKAGFVPTTPASGLLVRCQPLHAEHSYLRHSARWVGSPANSALVRASSAWCSARVALVESGNRTFPLTEQREIPGAPCRPGLLTAPSPQPPRRRRLPTTNGRCSWPRAPPWSPRPWGACSCRTRAPLRHDRPAWKGSESQEDAPRARHGSHCLCGCDRSPDISKLLVRVANSWTLGRTAGSWQLLPTSAPVGVWSGHERRRPNAEAGPAR